MTTLVRALRRYVGRPSAVPRSTSTAEERCEICGAKIGPSHRHVVERAKRSLLCSCGPCALLFVDERASQGRFRTVPDRVLAGDVHAIDDQGWRALGVPVGLAFVVRESTTSRARCIYPSPAGPVESEVEASAWASLAERVPLARAAQADVEAVLVRRGRDGRYDCFVVPIDRCYSVVGAVRSQWRGFDGGDDARAAIDGFFEQLRAESRGIDGGEGAAR